MCRRRQMKEKIENLEGTDDDRYGLMDGKNDMMRLIVLEDSDFIEMMSHQIRGRRSAS